MLVTDNEHATKQKRLFFRPQKPPFRCKVTPLTLHLLYIESVENGVTKAGNALHQADKKIRAPGLCRHRRGGDTAICRHGNEEGEKQAAILMPLDTVFLASCRHAHNATEAIWACACIGARGCYDWEP